MRIVRLFLCYVNLTGHSSVKLVVRQEVVTNISNFVILIMDHESVQRICNILRE